MSVPTNNIVRSISPKSIFESAKPVLSSSVSYNQGDLIAFDTTNKVLKAVAGSGDAANILGVARQTVVNGIAASPYQGTSVDASAAIDDVAGPVYGVVAFFKLNPGDAFALGAKVYPTTDPQTVTSTNPGNNNAIGIYQGQLAVSSAASGQFGDVLVGAAYGQAGLTF